MSKVSFLGFVNPTLAPFNCHTFYRGSRVQAVWCSLAKQVGTLTFWLLLSAVGRASSYGRLQEVPSVWSMDHWAGRALAGSSLALFLQIWWQTWGLYFDEGLASLAVRPGYGSVYCCQNNVDRVSFDAPPLSRATPSFHICLKGTRFTGSSVDEHIPMKKSHDIDLLFAPTFHKYSCPVHVCTLWIIYIQIWIILNVICFPFLKILLWGFIFFSCSVGDWTQDLYMIGKYSIWATLPIP